MRRRSTYLKGNPSISTSIFASLSTENEGTARILNCLIGHVRDCEDQRRRLEHVGPLLVVDALRLYRAVGLAKVDG